MERLSDTITIYEFCNFVIFCYTNRISLNWNSIAAVLVIPFIIFHFKKYDKESFNETYVLFFIYFVNCKILLCSTNPKMVTKSCLRFIIEAVDFQQFSFNPQFDLYLEVLRVTISTYFSTINLLAILQFLISYFFFLMK